MVTAGEPSLRWSPPLTLSDSAKPFSKTRLLGEFSSATVQSILWGCTDRRSTASSGPVHSKAIRGSWERRAAERTAFVELDSRPS